MDPEIDAFIDRATSSITYIVVEPEGSHCAIIDPVLDYDPKSGRISKKSLDLLIDYVEVHQLKVDWILETHVHADRLSAASHIREILGGSVAISRDIGAVQRLYGKIFNIGADFTPDGSQFDRLFSDGETFRIGQLEACAIHTPGHTPACITYLIGGAAFVGDTIFMPDYGTGRTDFPGGNADTLYCSIQKILSLPDTTRLYLCHDYKAPGRDNYVWQTTVADQKERNIDVGAGRSKQDFIAVRQARDKLLEMPARLWPALQFNMSAGTLPAAEHNGLHYFKIPLNAWSESE